MNILILFLHILIIGGITLFALRLGKEAMIAWLALLAVTSNLFIFKEISFIQWSATATDSLAVGYLLGLNLIQEFFSQKLARRAVWIAFFTTQAFLILSFIHLAYLPHPEDSMQESYLTLLYPTPRIFIASIFSFFVVQFFDLTLLAYLRRKTQGKYFPGRALVTSFLSEALDTVLFTLLALYGTYNALGEIMGVSLVIKILSLLFIAPFLAFAKRIRPKNSEMSYESAL